MLIKSAQHSFTVHEITLLFLTVERKCCIFPEIPTTPVTSPRLEDDQISPSQDGTGTSVANQAVVTRVNKR